MSRSMLEPQYSRRDSDEPYLFWPLCGGCQQRVEEVNDRDLCATCEPLYCVECDDDSPTYPFCSRECEVEHEVRRVIA